MRAKIIKVSQNGNATHVTVAMDHGAMPDFIYDPPSDAVKADPKLMEDYARDVAKRRFDHVENWKKGGRPGKELLGKVVSVNI